MPRTCTEYMRIEDRCVPSMMDVKTSKVLSLNIWVVGLYHRIENFGGKVTWVGAQCKIIWRGQDRFSKTQPAMTRLSTTWSRGSLDCAVLTLISRLSGAILHGVH